MKFVLSTSFNAVSEIRDIAIAADGCGWSAISFSDHIVHPEEITTEYPYTDDGKRRWDAYTDWPDPFVMIGSLSSITKNLRFTQNIFVLPIRNPFLVAKAVSTAAVVSNDRVTLCVGVGWSKDEFGFMQQDFHTRGKRTDEMIEILKKLWTGEMVSHSGTYYEFPKLEMNPKPAKPVPIWIGGISDAALRRAARIGDGW